MLLIIQLFVKKYSVTCNYGIAKLVYRGGDLVLK